MSNVPYSWYLITSSGPGTFLRMYDYIHLLLSKEMTHKINPQHSDRCSLFSSIAWKGLLIVFSLSQAFYPTWIKYVSDVLVAIQYLSWFNVLTVVSDDSGALGSFKSHLEAHLVFHAIAHLYTLSIWIKRAR